MPCKQCGSFAINHHSHGRDGSDGDLCDVCFWRKRAGALEAQVAALTIAIAACRDAFQVPSVGSELDGYYVGAIADPLLVADYVVAQVAALTKDAGRYAFLRDAHEGDEAEACCVFAPNDMRECLVPVGSLPGELDGFIDAAIAARKGTP